MRPPIQVCCRDNTQNPLDPALPASKVCSVRPTKVVTSSTYVIDMSKLLHPDIVKNDNFGAWKHSGSHPWPYRAQVEDGYVRVEKYAPCARGSDVLCLHCPQSVLPSNSHFKHLIAFISSEYTLNFLILSWYSPPNTLTHTHTHTHTHSHTHTHTHTHAHAHSYTHSHMTHTKHTRHTHTHTHKQKRVHTHTQTKTHKLTNH